MCSKAIILFLWESCYILFGNHGQKKFGFGNIVARGSTASSATYSHCVFSVLINLCDICVCSVSVCSTVVVVGFM